MDSSNGIVINMIAAVWYLTDMIIFNVLDDKKNNITVVEVCITINDFEENVFTIPFNSMDPMLKTIYNYVFAKSNLTFDNDKFTLIGTHIGRKRDYKYTMFNLDKNPIGTSVKYELKNPTQEEIDLYTDIYNTMINVKQI